MLTSWLNVESNSDFTLANIPFGVFSVPPKILPRCGTIIGDHVIDLSVLAEAGLFSEIENLSPFSVFVQPTLNDFAQHPRQVWVEVRNRIIQLFNLNDTASKLIRSDEHLRKLAIYNKSLVTMHLPMRIGDYTDFYSSRYHATNVGIMFRGKDNALQPNWLHLPVGYHGRSSTVLIDGTPIPHPSGQLPDGPTFGPSKQIDFELEVAFYVGGAPNPLGTRLTINEAYERIFGFVLMNDWSARDIQKWEYVPLGPFTAKNFATTVSPWIITTMALEPFATQGQEQTDPLPLEYLQDQEKRSIFDIHLEVAIQSLRMKQDGEPPATVCRSNFSHLYWTAAQQLVHHSVTGCTFHAGDLLGSGTISGPSDESMGSMLELSWKETRDVALNDKETRKFLQDGDTVVITGWAETGEHSRVGFGRCSGQILPLVPPPAARPLATPRYTNLKLFGYWKSSSTWRVRIALKAKSLIYEAVSVNLSEKEHILSEHTDRNPMGQIPVLEVTDTFLNKTFHISQSMAICELLEEVYPDPPMLPRDPLERALAREMCQVIVSGTQPLQNLHMLTELEGRTLGKIQAIDEGSRHVVRGLTAMEILVKKRLDECNICTPEYCLGGLAPTLVDAVLVPQIYNAKYVFEIDTTASFPTLAAIYNHCSQHEWFRASHPEVQADAR
jgi:fumarylacetoacetase